MRATEGRTLGLAGLGLACTDHLPLILVEAVDNYLGGRSDAQLQGYEFGVSGWRVEMRSGSAGMLVCAFQAKIVVYERLVLTLGEGLRLGK